MAESIYTVEHDEPLVMALGSNDEELKQSVLDAQNSLDVFLNLFEKYKESDGVFFAYKVAIQDEESTSHFWFTYNGMIDGKLAGEHFELPETLKDYSRIKVERDQIEDWMINDHGHLYGGYSIRLQRRNVPENERAQFDEYVGVSVYDENDFR